MGKTKHGQWKFPTVMMKAVPKIFSTRYTGKRYLEPLWYFPAFLTSTMKAFARVYQSVYQHKEQSFREYQRVPGRIADRY